VANFPDELSVNVLSSLVRYAPDEKEQKALLDFTGNPELLSVADRFLMTMYKQVHRFEQRLRVMIFEVCAGVSATWRRAFFHA
jgi:hypothetical protein